MLLRKPATLSWINDLYRLGQSTAVQGRDNQVYQQLLMHIVDGFDARSGALALMSADRASLTIVAGIDLPPGVLGKTIVVGEDILGSVAQQGTALLLCGPLPDDSPHRKIKRNENTVPESAICWPLKIDSNVIGVLSVNRFADRPTFSQIDVEQGTVILNLASLVLANIKLQREQQRRIADLNEANQRIEDAQNQLLQSEKMASIGQLAAGVAHEINNPIGFVSSNLGSLEKYLADIFSVLDAYSRIESSLPVDHPTLIDLRTLKQRAELEYLREDIPALMSESRDGIARIRNIVQSLKDFSYVDSGDQWKWANLHDGLESTINIGWNELKYKAEIKKEFGDIPEIECLPFQLNQVFLNMLINAGHAIEKQGVITIRTATIDDHVRIEISDTGSGITMENMKRIFEPFFTTKKIGQGTGLGLSLSYGIVRKHNGRIEVDSEVGKGTTFRIYLPIARAGKASAPESDKE